MLVNGVRDYSPDLVVLVARKMPRLVEALNLSLGDAVCVSDHAIPFVHPNIKGARVAIVDDIWNVGTTMLRARDRVMLGTPTRKAALFDGGERCRS
ncbi:hypoxanthine-guanine phosphoribosyltransferase [Bradyrhizobium diazoefficiens]